MGSPMAMEAEMLLPAALRQLLADLRSPLKCVEETPDLGKPEFGGYFLSFCPTAGRWGQKAGQLDTANGMIWQVRLQVLKAVGKCTSLRRIHLFRIGKERREEMEAVLAGLPANPVLEELHLDQCGGFEAKGACEALGDIVRSSATLQMLRLSMVEISAGGVGQIARGLKENPGSALRCLTLCSVQVVGGCAGAQQVCDILSSSARLRQLAFLMNGLDEEGARVLAKALAHDTCLEELELKDYSGSKDVVGIVLESLIPQSGVVDEHMVACNRSVKRLATGAVPMGTIARLLQNNHCLQQLALKGGSLGSAEFCAIFEALYHSPSITSFTMSSASVHRLTEASTHAFVQAVQGNRKLEKLHLPFWELPLQDEHQGGSGSSFRKQFFRALSSSSIKDVSIQGWKHLGEHLFQVLMESLHSNTSLVALNVSDTCWEQEPNIFFIKKALECNATRRCA